MVRRWLTLATLASGSAYLLLMNGDSPLRWLAKPGAVVLMLLLAASARTGDKVYRGLIVTGLAFSVLGDIFLLAVGELWFMLGLASFFMAHVLYIPAFLRRRRFHALHVVAYAAILAYAGLFLRGLHPGVLASSDQTLWYAVVSYVVVIVLMAFSAMASQSRGAAIGALLFVISDSILAWSRFVEPFAFSDYGVMITYYAAQYLIASSVGEEPSAEVAA